MTEWTIRAFIDGGMAIHAYCDRFDGRACHHSARLDLYALGDRLGFDLKVSHDLLTPLLVCAACGSRRVTIRVSPCYETAGYEGAKPAGRITPPG